MATFDLIENSAAKIKTVLTDREVTSEVQGGSRIPRSPKVPVVQAGHVIIRLSFSPGAVVQFTCTRPGLLLADQAFRPCTQNNMVWKCGLEQAAVHTMTV